MNLGGISVNGTLLTSDGRSVLRFERVLPHPPEKVWRAITESDELSGWFPARMEGERKVGAPLRFVAEGEDTFGEILEFDGPRVFAFSWNDSVLRFELRQDPVGCLLIFTHTYSERPFSASFATGWHHCLDELVDVLVSGGPGESEALSGKRWYRAHHEAYAQIFELLRGEVTDGTVRFERLLPYPREEVWEALTGGSAVAVGEAAPADVTSGAVSLGSVTEAEKPATVSYDSPSGPVCWELAPGPGGTLLKLTHTAPEAERVDALVAWHLRIEGLADGLARSNWGATPAEALRKHYDAHVDD
jgi:uncharacterized protein YndB with AHSA1/START domain